MIFLYTQFHRIRHAIGTGFGWVRFHKSTALSDFVNPVIKSLKKNYQVDNEKSRFQVDNEKKNFQIKWVD